MSATGRIQASRDYVKRSVDSTDEGHFHRNPRNVEIACDSESANGKSGMSYVIRFSVRSDEAIFKM